ncbi:MAG TPA: HDIG domain-containing protein [Candidatus Acidoferrales bacterium]|nr:HDIG domain-containing protein [Candidatus Acidoferrales bacterium]
MSNPLPSREQAIELLRKNNCSPKVISHCQAVAEISLEIANQLKKKGFKLDLKLVEAGALLHDIGRSKTNAVDHGIVGAQIALSEGLPTAVAQIIKAHVGGGFTAKEAVSFGWPQGIYTPISVEEKIVSYADKLVDNSKRGRAPIDLEIKRLQAAGHKDSAERVRRLHAEVTALLGN